MEMGKRPKGHTRIRGESQRNNVITIDRSCLAVHTALDRSVAEMLRKRFPESLWGISIFSEKFWSVI